MIKNKGMDTGKSGGNYPAGATLTGTEKTRVGGQMPATAALPTMADQFPWLTAQAGVAMPNPQETSTLPMFSASSGYTDTGVGHSGPLGGAGA